jgi:site-specific recombinase XerD
MSKVLSDSDLNQYLQETNENFYSTIPDAAAFPELLYYAGFRVQEVYQASRWTLFDTVNYAIQTEKGGNVRYWPILDTPPEVINAIETSTLAFQNLRYSTFAKWFGRLFPRSFLTANGKHVATHAYRYNRCKIMHNDGVSDADIAAFLGEAYVANVKIYYNAVITVD